MAAKEQPATSPGADVLSPEMQVLVRELKNITGQLTRIGNILEVPPRVASQPASKPALAQPAVPPSTPSQPAEPTGIPRRDDPVALLEYFKAVGKEFNGAVDRVKVTENLTEKTIEVTSPYFPDKKDFGRFAGHMKETFDAEYVADRDHKRYYWVIKKP